MTLVRLVTTGPLDSPVVVAAMDGWVDSGSAATMAATMLAEDGDTMATFDGDRIYDYRARRPTLEIVNGTPSGLTWPELKLVRRRLDGRDVLVLSGPEPDYRWQSYFKVSYSAVSSPDSNLAKILSLSFPPSSALLR